VLLMKNIKDAGSQDDGVAFASGIIDIVDDCLERERHEPYFS